DVASGSSADDALVDDFYLGSGDDAPVGAIEAFRHPRPGGQDPEREPSPEHADRDDSILYPAERRRPRASTGPVRPRGADPPHLRRAGTAGSWPPLQFRIPGHARLLSRR